MGSQWVEDPSWNNIFSGFVSDMAGAPGKALSNIHAAETIKDQRIKRQREQEQWDLGTTTGNKFEAALPPAYAPPSTQTVLGPYVGAPNATPDQMPDLPTADVQYTDPRALAAAQARRDLAVAAGWQLLRDHPEQAIPQLGYGSVAATGVPKTQDERDQTQFYTTGKFPSAQERAPPAAHNLVVIGADGQPTGQTIGTQDFKRSLQGVPIQSLLKPGETTVAGGAASATQPNPYENQAVALKGLAAIEADRQKNGIISEDQARLAMRLFDVAHPTTRVVEQEGGRAVEKQVRAQPVPPSLMPLFTLADDYAKGKHLQPPGAAPPPGAQPPPPDAAAPPAAIVDPNASRVMSRGPANPAELRKEIINSQQYDDFNKAVTVYNSAIQSAKNPTNQGDLDIIYAIAKLFDPGSVVRGEELKMASSTGTIGQQLMQRYSQLYTGQGMLDPDVRVGLLEAGRNRMQQYGQAKDVIANYYATKVIPNQGLKPEEVLPPTLPMGEFDRNEIVRLGNAAAASQPPRAPVARRAADDITGVK